MDQPLDLCITLVPPPADASPETIAAIELRCDQLGLQHKGNILVDPLTTRDHENVRWYLEEYADWPYEQFLERGKKIEASLSKFGKRLYDAVCGSAGAMSVVQPWRLLPEVQRQVSIVSYMPQALSLPWELLHDEQGFLVLRTRNPVLLIRRLPQGELAGFPTSFEPPLRILLVTARPDDAGFIDPRSIARELLDEVQQQVDAGAIALEFLRPPTLGALRARLSDTKLPPIHILHFDGHGVFDEERDRQGKRLSSKKQGMLAFENDDGKLDLVKAKDVAQVLQDSGVHLAVLTACQSAMGAADDAFSSVAAQLIRSGVDAVTAMSASVLARLYMMTRVAIFTVAAWKTRERSSLCVIGGCLITINSVPCCYSRRSQPENARARNRRLVFPCHASARACPLGRATALVDVRTSCYRSNVTCCAENWSCSTASVGLGRR